MEAYRYVDAADQLLDHIASRPAVERAELWSRDHGGGLVPSPRRYFGPYTPDALDYTRGAVDKARRRFVYDGPVGFRGIDRLRCRRYCADDPSAFHFPTQEIATCPKFWKRVRNGFVARGERLAQSAFTLTHEMFHWIRVDGLYVVDFHTDGAGRHPNRKYYGIDNVTYLAENVQRWAIRNNDTYALFAQAVKSSPPPTYAGALLAHSDAATFDKLKGEQDATQQLIDFERYPTASGAQMHLGVWRVGGPGRELKRDRTATDFDTLWRSLWPIRTMIDVEEFSTLPAQAIR